MKRSLSLLVIFLITTVGVSAQDVALKTNLLTDVAASPNLGVEIGLAPKWSIDITGEINAWDINHHKWKHWFVEPEARYWLCDTFAGHFFGLHAIAGQYNFGNIRNNINFLGSDFSKLSDHRYQGWGAGAGIAYGYDWILSKHWNLEAEIGIGWIYTKYDVYSCNTCSKKIATGRHHNYFGPTKLAINIEYLF